MRARFLSILFLSVFVTSIMPQSLGIHLCGGKPQGITWGELSKKCCCSKASSCCSAESIDSDCKRKSESQLKKSECCSNISLETSKEFLSGSTNRTGDSECVPTAHLFSYQRLETLDSIDLAWGNHIPPLRNIDIVPKYISLCKLKIAIL